MTREPGRVMEFQLTTHEAQWLWNPAVGVPLFVSRQRLTPPVRKNVHPSTGPWMLDSGGYRRLSRTGEWGFTARDYAAEARRFADEIGQLVAACPMDWMCEEHVLAKTGLTVTEHQKLTLETYLELRWLDDGLPWRLTLQGWDRDDYLRHRDAYEAAGIDTAAEPLVFLGSVCARQDTRPAELIIRSLAPLRLHGLGIKTTGLLRYGHRLASCDSLAWSYNARRNEIHMEGHRHRVCANCPERALAWRAAMLAKVAAARARGIQLDLYDQDDRWASRMTVP